MAGSSLSPEAVFESVAARLDRGQRLSADDGLALFDPAVDLHRLGQLADDRRRAAQGATVYYNLNVHVNPTNVCRFRCPLCAYSRDSDDPAAYVLSEDEMVEEVRAAADDGATEVHIVGGVHPEKPFSWYLNIVRLLHGVFPRLSIKAWTAAEIAWFAEISGRSVAAVLEAMVDAGLSSLPGGGAEIFDAEIRRQIAPRKADADAWLEVHRTAHRMGLRSTATMLYGHLESAADRVDHMMRLRRLQDETGGFLTFIPLSFHPENTGLAHLEKTGPLDDLRTMAVARLLLDNFDHLKAYWVSLGVGVGQAALGYGADDLDGTVRRERIHHDAGATSPEGITVEALEGLIREADREPVERDTLYRRVVRDGTQWSVEA
jgi:aminodeoxyfutalosine synthase